MPSVAASLPSTALLHTMLLGITTPLSGVAVSPATVGPVLAIVSVQHGALSAELGPGATVRGGGSAMLWVSGEVAEVNAKLATLTYLGTDAGSDRLTVLILDGQGALTSVQAPVRVLPLAVATAEPVAPVLIDGGTLTLENRVLDGPHLSIVELSGSQRTPAAILINTTLTARSTLSFRNDSAGGPSPRLAIAGQVRLDGITSFAGAATSISLAKGASLFNEGTITIEAGAAQFAGAGMLINNGTVAIGNGSGIIRIGTTLGGTGQVTLAESTVLALDGTVGPRETILFGAGAQTLHLANPAGFTGILAGLSHSDAIVLDGAAATSAFFSGGTDIGSGTLSLFDGAHPIGNLRLTGLEPGATFQLGTDPAGNATVRLADAKLAGSHTTTPVYRFFDTAHGTQLLTQSAAERDAIQAGRPDLRDEGVAFGAVQTPGADADTVAIYRFFDTSNGTHFLTASATERDALLSARPDFVFEPGSTLFEHATAVAGDAAVYRFFEATSGAHFFTADPVERASLLHGRPDMTPEGIAFYAPRA